jgi:hypothetical protein
MRRFSKGGAALSPEMRDDAMGRQHRERKPDKARCRSDARNTFPEHLPLLLEFAVPLGFEKSAANRGFYEKGDRRGSNPRPSLEPQVRGRGFRSIEMGFWWVGQ